MTRRRSKDGRRAEAIARDLTEIGNDSDFPFRIRSNESCSPARRSSAGAGDNHSSLSARRRNSSGTERTTRIADP
jgi:hypothetical protein